MRLCSRAATSCTLSSFALTMSRSWPRSATRKRHVRREDGALGGGIPSATKQRQATSASGIASLHVPKPSRAPARAHSHTHTRGAPLGRTLLQERGRAKPPARDASVRLGSDDFRAVFCRLILLVSPQFAFNHGSKSDGMASFPSGFGHTASGRSLAEPTGREKYLAALRGASRPPLLAPGAARCRRSEAWELGARERLELRAEAQSGLPQAASSARGCSPEENLAGEGALRQRARRAHTPHSSSAAATWVGMGWGESCAHCRLAWARGAGMRRQRRRRHRAASGPGCAGTEWESPRSPARPGEPAWLAPLCLPSSVLDSPCLILDARRAPRCRQRPQSQRCKLRSARPGQSEKGATARSARWAVCSEQTLGSPGSQYPQAPAPPRRGQEAGATSAP